MFSPMFPSRHSISTCPLFAAASSNGAAPKAAASPSSTSKPVPTVPAPKSWAISESDFESGGVNQKSLNIARLRLAAKSPSFELPSSAALPFGSFEKALADPVNNGVASKVKKLVKAVESFKGKG
jgi:hypothetical protein